jgi:hypothetical protein
MDVLWDGCEGWVDAILNCPDCDKAWELDEQLYCWRHHPRFYYDQRNAEDAA